MDAPDDLVAFCAMEHPRLVGAVGAYLGDVAVAEELAQEALIRVARRWSRVSRMRSPSAFAYRVAINLATSHLRRQGAERRAHQRLSTDAVSFEDPDMTTRLLVRDHLAALPDAQRSVVALRHIAGLSVEQTATALGLSQDAVRSRCKRGMDQLRTSLGAPPRTTEQEVVHDG